MRLQGKALVQFFDAKTGKETFRHEEHNIITNALDSLMNGCPYGLDRRTWGQYSTGSSVDWSKITETALGGILVFSNALTASADHLFEGLSNLPVAYGSRNGQDTSDTKAGSFNEHDSGEIANGYKFVYDFSTSAGNGTWNAVCLTSALAGEGYEKSYAKTFGTYFKRGSGNYVCVGFVKKYALFKSGSKIYGMRTEALDVPLVSQLSGNPSETILDSYSGSIFADYENDCIYTVSGTDPLTLTRYDMDDLENPTTTTIDLAAAIPGTYSPIFCKSGNYIYIGYSNTGSGTQTNNKVYKINTTNGADVTEITVTTLTDYRTSYRPMCVLPSGDIYCGTDIIDTNNTVHHFNDATTGFSQAVFAPFTPIGVWSACGFSNYYDYGVVLNDNYLGTIYNLPNAVTKDASKTAKITYSLTYVEES